MTKFPAPGSSTSTATRGIRKIATVSRSQLWLVIRCRIRDNGGRQERLPEVTDYSIGALAMQKKLQVFVSSTYTDMLSERQAVVEAILLAGHIPAGMELFAAGDKSQLETIRRWIDESDVFMLILGGRYGSIDPESQESYIHLEYEYAIARKMPFFAAVIDDAALEQKIKDHGRKVLEVQNDASFQSFKANVKSRICRPFSDTKDLKLIVLESLPKIAYENQLSGWVRASDVTEPSPLVEEIRNLRKQLEAVTRERDEIRANGNAKQSPGKIKNFLFELGLKGRKALQGGDEKQKTDWWESLPSIVSGALYSRQFRLFDELYRGNARHECATYLVQATELRDNDVNTDFKPEVSSHAELIALYQELKDRLEEWPRIRPTSGTAQTLPKMEKEFGQKMKSTLIDLLSQAKAEADKVSLGGYFATACASLPQMEPEYLSIIKCAKNQANAFEAVLKKLA